MSPSVALLTLSLSRWETEGRLSKNLRWMLWPVLLVSVAIPIVLISTVSKWVPVKYGFSIYHIVIPIIILFVGTIIALFTFIRGRHFSQVQKVFCLTNCLFLIITIVYSAKYLGTFRSTKDIVEKCLLDKKEDYALVSYSDADPSLVFYSGKNVLEARADASLKELIPDQKKSIYVVISLHDYQQKKDWIQNKGLHAVCQNNAHILLKSGNN